MDVLEQKKGEGTMRKHETNRKITVHAIAGSYVVTLGFDATSKARAGLLGFAIQRTDHTEDEKAWLRGFKTFEDTMPDPTPGRLVDSRQHPIQGFHWADFTAKPGHKYTYRVVPMYGTPASLLQGDSVSATVSTEREDHGTHAIYFNRGVAGSQAYARRFGDTRPKTEEAFRWLSRGLEEAILAFIGQADGKRYALRAAVYEFSHMPVLSAFKAAAKSGADVKIVYDARKDPPRKTTEKAIKAARIAKLTIPRATGSAISHNKFIVLLKDGKPIQVWTGSTNFTEGGIFGQSNVGHLVRDHEVAQRYFEYWQQLSQDPEYAPLRKWNKATTPVPEGPPPKHSLLPVFSPRPSLAALEWYAKRMDLAKECIHFTAAFGVNKLLRDVLQEHKEYLRYVLLDNPGSTAGARHNTGLLMGERENRIAIGATLATGELHRWLHERLTGMNTHVKYIHTKYMLIDAVGDDPITISGSANFSDASTKSNDENMLIIRGNTRVADVYLGEFMRLFNHFYFRDVVSRQAAASGREIKKPYLEPNDSWTEPYYRKGSVRWKQRLLFRGKTRIGHGITFLDIDETLFHTSAKVWVMKGRKVVRKLTNRQYNTYKLKAGESFDYREFRDADLFAKTSRIIRSTLAKIREMLKNALRTGSKMAFLTARSTFDDMGTFKGAFTRYGIQVDKMDLNFAGDIASEAGSVAAAKKQIVSAYLANGEYKRARLIDDSTENLKAFLALRKDFPDVTFTAIHIDKDGKTQTLKTKTLKT